MDYKRKYTILEIFNVLYFLALLFVIACKFGLFFEKKVRETIFNTFYYSISPIIFVISIVLIIVFLIKSKREMSNEDGLKNLISTINMGTISFDFIVSLLGTILIQKKIAYEWLELTIYVNMIVIIIDSLIYAFVRGKILNNFSYFDQKDIINKYIVYVIIASFIFGIIIPNFMLHVGIVEVIKNY